MSYCALRLSDPLRDIGMDVNLDKKYLVPRLKKEENAASRPANFSLVLLSFRK